ncbi:DNA-3-methyladenine glycosylase I [Labedella phragmitis]|uniref:DNA-3-methyladenine glycosylase I n=1 Tax=Labedella phragmitis TaxID=2498849 RepID=A0A444PQ64_9MICO|nr:DNA-3-methyladenine glycosylase I [Labedella phragmitis]RWZ46571.1 DNA-3-methyladenine glycosylase I [Labedella phragmitis]
MDTAPDHPDNTPARAGGSARATTLLGADGVRRCAWSGLDAEYQRYHDEEWGRPLLGDRDLFEKISLEGFQSGLSWITILRRREAFRSAFHGFDPEVVARMDDGDVIRLMGHASIIRNRRKIEATIANAKAVLALDEPLSAIVWRFASKPGQRRRPRSWEEVPATTAESTALSSELKARGFRFVGPTTMYALMQSGGLVDDHLEGCWRADEADGRSADR